MSLNHITSFENLPNDTILQYAQSLMKTMEEYGIGKTTLIEKLKTNNPVLYDKFCEKVREHYASLNARYPGIVNMIVNYGQDFDIKRLASLLGIAERLNKGEIPELETHFNISTQLRNEFVLPKLGIAPQDVEPINLNEYTDERLKQIADGSLKTNISFNSK